MRIEFVGPIDGVNQSYTTPATGLTTVQDFSVFYNGTMLDYNTDYSFTAPNGITLTFAPTSGDKLWGLKYLT